MEQEQEILLSDQAIRLVLAVMRSASTEKIRPLDWWTRARSALEAAASAADNYRYLVSRMASKLQIDAYAEKSSVELADIGQIIAPHWLAFREMCEREAVYIVAMAQAQRAEQKKGLFE